VFALPLLLMFLLLLSLFLFLLLLPVHSPTSAFRTGWFGWDGACPLLIDGGIHQGRRTCRFASLRSALLSFSFFRFLAPCVTRGGVQSRLTVTTQSVRQPGALPARISVRE
jgi:hypothetical protein